MRTLGIVGGIGPESTIEYYRTIIGLCREKVGPEHYPPIIINSINVAKMLGMIQRGQLGETADYILDAVRSLARAGADFGLIASNTPHLVFDDIAERSPIPLISIVRATCDAAKGMGLGKLALLGTRTTVQGGFYQKHFAAPSCSRSWTNSSRSIRSRLSFSGARSFRCFSVPPRTDRCRCLTRLTYTLNAQYRR